MLDSVNSHFLCEQVPRIGNKFGRWFGNTVFKLIGFQHIAQKTNLKVFLVAFDYMKKHIEFGPTHYLSDNTHMN